MVSFTCEPSCHTRSSTPIAASSILMSTFLVWKHFHPERLGSRVQDTEQICDTTQAVSRQYTGNSAAISDQPVRGSNR
jgi:hypothetical protein